LASLVAQQVRGFGGGPLEIGISQAPNLAPQTTKEKLFGIRILRLKITFPQGIGPYFLGRGLNPHSF